ncbi:MAG: trigger factor [Deltaproteobacteria bacterium]|nr:trigger factor [Deltaproteobacteria bacterium]
MDQAESTNQAQEAVEAQKAREAKHVAEAQGAHDGHAAEGAQDAAETEHEAETKSIFSFEVETSGPTEKVIQGEVQWDEVKSRLDSTYKELSKQVNLKGFRRGKVPRGLLAKMFGKQVHEEVSKQLAREAVAEAVTKHKLRVVASPSDWDVTTEPIEKDQPLKFRSPVEVLPDIEPKDYFGIEMEQEVSSIREEEIDEYIQRQQQQLTQYVPVEDRTVIEPGDVVNCDVMGKLGDQPLDMEDTSITIPEGEGAQATEPLPGLAAALLGKDTKDADISLELTFGEDQDQAIAGKTARILITVTKLSRAMVPEIDDDFAKDTGMADTVKDLRKAVETKLLELRERNNRQEAEEKLLDEVCERNPVELTENVVAMERARLKESLSSMLGMDVDSLPSSKDILDKQAIRRVHRALVLDAIADKERLEVTEEDIDAHFEKLAAQRNANPIRLKAQAAQSGSLDGLRSELRERKTIDLLMEHAHGTPKAKHADGASSAEGTKDAKAEKKAAKKATKAKTTKTKATKSKAAKSEDKASKAKTTKSATMKTKATKTKTTTKTKSATTKTKAAETKATKSRNEEDAS